MNVCRICGKKPSIFGRDDLGYRVICRHDGAILGECSVSDNTETGAIAAWNLQNRSNVQAENGVRWPGDDATNNQIKRIEGRQREIEKLTGNTFGSQYTALVKEQQENHQRLGHLYLVRDKAERPEAYKVDELDVVSEEPLKVDDPSLWRFWNDKALELARALTIRKMIIRNIHSAMGLPDDVGAYDWINQMQARVKSLELAHHAIIERSQNSELGTSKVFDMRKIAEAALKGGERS